jgi:uncharacterized membrane protein YfcA
MPLETIAPAALIVAAAYTVFGVTGFGASITALPLLAHVMPIRTAVPMMLVFDLGAGLAVGLRNRRLVATRELSRLLPYMLAGMALGVTALVNAPERLLLGVLGALVLAYAGVALLRPVSRTPIAAGWAAPLGAAGGIFTALFGTGGPIYTVYLARRIADPATLRATLGALIFASGLARLALFAGAGLYAQADVLRLALWLSPFALIGLFAGSRMHRRVPARRIVQAIWAVLIVGGASLLWRSLRGA